MENQLVQFEVSSPDELREALTKLPADSKARFAAVRVFGPEVMVRLALPLAGLAHHCVTRHFELPHMPASDLAGEKGS